MNVLPLALNYIEKPRTKVYNNIYTKKLKKQEIL